jgi:hypothetical protein
VRWVDDAFPGFVEAVLTDAAGQEHRLIEKPPVLGDDPLTPNTDYPTTVRVPCDVLGEMADGTVEVALRHGIQSDDGTARFRVDAGSVEGG